jgi:hypothetical protein
MLKSKYSIFLILIMFSATLFAQKVYIEDNLFKVNGQQLYLNGANTPWNSWNDLGRSFNYDWWNNHFAELHDAGINSTRVWLSCDPNHEAMLMDENGQLQGVSDAFWTDMDSLMAIAERHQVYIMGALMSFDHFKGAHQNSYKWTKMMKSEDNVDLFVENYAVPLVQRYQDNPYLFSIDACNEIIWVSNTENTSENAVSWENIQYYVGKVAQRVHETSDVLVCTSNYIKYTSPNYNGNNYSDENLYNRIGDEDAYVDFYKIHYYTWVSPWFGGFHATHTPAYYSLDDKPSITGEMPANKIYVQDANGKETFLMDVIETYEVSYQNGWQGTMAWTSNGVDEFGSLENNLAKATEIFRDNHYNLVFPNSFSEYLNVSTDSLNFFRYDTLSSFEISSNISWTINENTEWIHLSETQGEGYGMIVLEILPNNSGENRSATIEISSSLGTETIVLNQSTLYDEPLTANAGEDHTYPDLFYDGVETITLDGSLSSDANGQIVAYSWLLNDVEIANEETARVELTIGIHEIVLMVIDNDGNSDRDTVIIEIYNNSPQTKNIPGKFEAEDYTEMSGLQTQATEDIGGGLNTSHVEDDDWLGYNTVVAYSGIYRLDIRHAGWPCTVDVYVDGEYQRSFDFPETEGWQVWQTSSYEIELHKGDVNIRFEFNCTGINFNWLEFSLITEIDDDDDQTGINEVKTNNTLINKIYPLPSINMLTIDYTLPANSQVKIDIFNALGKHEKQLANNFVEKGNHQLIWQHNRVNNGIYLLKMSITNNNKYYQETCKIIVAN